MMRRTSVLLLFGVMLVGPGCEEDNPAPDPSTLPPVFTATLTTPAEVPAVTNGESGTGTVRITFNLTKDAGGTITGGTVDFEVTISGLTGAPNGPSTITLAHIHEGAAGVQGGILVNTGVASGQVTLTNGAGSFTRTGTTFGDIANAQRILNNPQGFYFNVHSGANGSGIIRGQLTRIQ